MCELGITWLVGTTVQFAAVDEVGRWKFTMANGGVINVDCPWRLIIASVIAISSADHGQQYGGPAVLDAAAEVSSRLKDSIVSSATVLEGTADLVLTFSRGERFEVLPFSIGYEAWELVSPTSHLLVAQGGRALTGFRPSTEM